MPPVFEAKPDLPAADVRLVPESTPPYETPVIEKLGHWQVVTLSGSIGIGPGGG